MINRLIDWSLHQRVFVLVVAALLSVASIIAVRGLTLDAIPDLSDTQVIIRTSYPGQAPQIVEDQITYPITTRMLSVPHAKAVRGFSMFGDSFVYILFDDGTDPYWARSRVLEYLSQLRNDLPPGIDPQLGPDATGVGWVYQYALIDRSGGRDLAQLRSMQDWFLRFELQAVEGVAEVASVGGFVRQYEAVVDPLRLQVFNLSFAQLIQAIRESSAESGAGAIELAEAEYIVRGVGYIKSLDEFALTPVGVNRSGVPVLLRDVAQVRFAPAARRGIADFNGEGEAVGGIVVMRDGENAHEVIQAVHKKIEDLRSSLPQGVEIVTTYDRSALIDRAVTNLSEKLFEELLVVILVCALFLWHFRSSLVIAISLPLGVLMALAVMRVQGLNANIMSLGGIALAIGAMVDASIVMVENAHKHLENYSRSNNGQRASGAKHWQVIGDAAKEVGPALFFSLLITAFSFLPVFVLEAQEGRMFEPLAWTKTWAMALSAGLAITLVPVLMGYWVRGDFKDESEHALPRYLMAGYEPFLRKALKFPKSTVLIALVLFVSSALPWHNTGTEFMPQLEEGDLLYMPTTLPGLSPGEAQELLQRTDALIMSVPEVATVFGKAGRADSATDPAPLTMIETVIQFHPQDQWRAGMTMEKLVQELDRTVQIPGLTNAWVPPILNRINMQVSGIRTELGLRVSGDNLQLISSSADAFANQFQGIDGVRSAFAERASDAPYIDVLPDREQLARYGLSMAEFQMWLASAIGGEAQAQVIEGRERYPIAVRLAQSYRDSREALAGIPIVTPSGAHVTLGAVADIQFSNGPAMIRSEDARLSGFVFIDLEDGADLSAVVQEAERRMRESGPGVPGISWDWVGSYEYLQRAQAKLMLAIPLTLLIVFALLYAAFRSVTESAIIMLTIPFALVGGIWLVWLLDYDFSVAVAVGFIALAGLAAEFGVVMLVYLKAALLKAQVTGISKPEQLDAALTEGALRRIRPKAMTVLTIVFGLMPIMFADGAGAETMKRIAAPMLGGMFTAPLLSLLVIPAIYRIWLGRVHSITRQGETS